ncbi:alpha/beta fold hydrolase [uncultured Streptomyces sp.]|uniref:alpha/beta fold hydrolase n=1 Tax=uncultured Streptomyces sp. TaxID=174707 RepID=UPI002610FB28|nr:alpha/beta hydrolase [uncultured Streptomyces sp.]
MNEHPEPVRCTVEAGMVKLSHRVRGPRDGPPLVLLHALGESAEDWDTVAPVLARKRRVYAVDLRGHGRSDWPGEYSLELMRDDVIGYLDALGLDRADLIGHSLGGLVAYLVAQHRPGRVHRLVLEDVPVPRPRTPAVPVRPEGALSFDWEMVLAVRRQIDSPDPEWWDLLGSITADVLVLGGGPRSHVPQGGGTGVAEWPRRVPGARVATLPVGHLIHRADPHRFLEAVQEFLAES